MCVRTMQNAYFVQPQNLEKSTKNMAGCNRGAAAKVDTAAEVNTTGKQQRYMVKSPCKSHPVKYILPHILETKNFLTKITNDLVMATPIDSRKSRQTRNAINQPQSHPI